MLVCVFFVHFAHETAGAACTRLSLRPLSLGGPKVTQSSDAARRENVRARLLSAVIVRESGRASIPEAAVIEPRSRGVPDTAPSRAMTGLCGTRLSHRCNDNPPQVLGALLIQ